MAADMKAELLGLFVEDINLLRLSGLQFARGGGISFCDQPQTRHRCHGTGLESGGGAGTTGHHDCRGASPIAAFGNSPPISLLKIDHILFQEQRGEVILVRLPNGWLTRRRIQQPCVLP
jgi:hypothetical protein